MLFQLYASAEPPRMHFEIPRDAITPFRMIQDDEMLGKLCLVLLEASHLDGSAGATAGRQEAMPVRQSARLHILHLRPARL